MKNNLIFNLYCLFIRIISCFIPSNELRKKFRVSWFVPAGVSLFMVLENGKRQRIFFPPSGLRLEALCGKNNVVEIFKGSKFRGTSICFGSESAFVKLGVGSYNNTRIIATYADNQQLIIGGGFTCYGAVFHLKENNATIEIGNNCLFSTNIEIWACDGHTIFENGKAINFAKPVKIGNQVWIGTGVKIGKGVVISDDSVAGMGAVIVGKFMETNVILAGNPAKIIKRNIVWDKRNPHHFVNQ